MNKYLSEIQVQMLALQVAVITGISDMVLRTLLKTRVMPIGYWKTGEACVVVMQFDMNGNVSYVMRDGAVLSNEDLRQWVANHKPATLDVSLHTVNCFHGLYDTANRVFKRKEILENRQPTP